MVSWDLEQAWEQRWCPVVNGVLFPDGSAVAVEARPAAGGPPAVGPRTPLAQLAAGGLRWTTLGPLTRTFSPDRKLLAAVGEGGLGGDGFVALMTGPMGALVWLAFFDDSTAFEAVRFDGDSVAARTADGREWRFPVAAPERVVVE
jgi:hypothetical protein